MNSYYANKSIEEIKKEIDVLEDKKDLVNLKKKALLCDSKVKEYQDLLDEGFKIHCDIFRLISYLPK